MAPGGQQAQRELCPCLIISFLASLGLCCHRFSLTSVSGGYSLVAVASLVQHGL